MPVSTAEERLLEAIRERRGTPVARHHRLAELGVDSVEMAMLVRELEDRFGIAVDEEIFDLETVGDLVDYVEQRSRSR